MKSKGMFRFEKHEEFKGSFQATAVLLTVISRFFRINSETENSHGQETGREDKL